MISYKLTEICASNPKQRNNSYINGSGYLQEFPEIKQTIGKAIKQDIMMQFQITFSYTRATGI